MKKNSLIKNVVFLGKKPGAGRAIQYLLDRGIAIKMIIARKENGDAIYGLAKQCRIPIFEDDQILYKKIKRQDKNLSDIDLVVSYLFWRKIRMPLINLAKKGCINFHPAPLPDYRGLAGYNMAILDQKKTYGVSAHFIDSEEFDAGPIVKVKKFPIDSKHETVISLERKSQENLLLLFQEVINGFLRGEKLITRKNKGGIYLNKKQFQKLKKRNF